MLARFEIIGLISKITQYEEKAKKKKGQASVYISASTTEIYHGKLLVTWFNNITARGQVAESVLKSIKPGYQVWFFGVLKTSRSKGVEVTYLNVLEFRVVCRELSEYADARYERETEQFMKEEDMYPSYGEDKDPNRL